MSARFLRTVVVAASLACVPACSIVFDPAQYRGDGGPSGPDAPGPDAPGLDAPGLDAPGLDAPGLDAPASSICNEPSTRTALPTCGSGVSDLTYCAPTAGGTELTLDAGAAPSILGGPGSYLLDTLGNNHQIVSGGAGTIADHAIAVSSDGRLTVSWLADRGFSRVTHTIASAGLELGTSESPVLTPGAVSLSSLAAIHGQQLVVGQTADQSTLWRCDAVSCGMIESQDSGVRLLAAYGQAAAFTATDGRMPTFSRPAMNPVTVPPAAAGAERLVGTDGPLVFSPSAGVAFFHDGTSVIATPSWLPGARVAHEADTSFVVARLEATFQVSTAALTCAGSACACPGCDTPDTEVRIEAPGGPLVDWTFEVTEDGLRVAVLLVADMGGETDVFVAAWRPGTVGPITPVHLASGVGFRGEGRSIRSVVRYVAGDRLEVFVSALVHFDADAQDRIFLSGMRLLRCP